MRYLLMFHTPTTSQWRCLDTAFLPVRIGTPGDLPEVLRAAPEIMLRWMLARREIGAFSPGRPVGSAGQIVVYRLDRGAARFSMATGYQGVRLEMFMLSNRPVGTITLRAALPRKPASLGLLERRIADPLKADDPVCQQTMDILREQGGRAARIGAMPRETT
ncbi:hypothetical protein [Paenirhodobacter sp.]|uniref:hypothetical protein n=1 Tax=Paenirhodobacter sp. TaxID=1965326 RepID=UPI003B3FD0B5